MRKRIMILTDNYHAVTDIQGELIELNYEVMTSEGLVEDIYEGNSFFISAFDLIVVHEAEVAWVTKPLLETLMNLNLAIIILSPEQRDDFIEVINEHTLFLQYPTTLKNLYETIEKLLHQNHQVFQSVKSVLASETSSNGELETEPKVQVQGAYRAFTPNGSTDIPCRNQQPQLTKNNDLNKQILLRDKLLVIDEKLVYLSNKEQELLTLLVEANYEPVSSQQLYEKIWNCEYSNDKQPYISNLVKKIRLKVKDTLDSDVSIILNQKNRGYYLNSIFVGESA